jgi:hypothetical protein
MGRAVRAVTRVLRDGPWAPSVRTPRRSWASTTTTRKAAHAATTTEQQAAAPGGLLALAALSEVDAGPGPFQVRPGELPAAFAELEVLAAGKRNGEAWLLARLEPRRQVV